MPTFYKITLGDYTNYFNRFETLSNCAEELYTDYLFQKNSPYTMEYIRHLCSIERDEDEYVLISQGEFHLVVSKIEVHPRLEDFKMKPCVPISAAELCSLAKSKMQSRILSHVERIYWNVLSAAEDGQYECEMSFDADDNYELPETVNLALERIKSLIDGIKIIPTEGYPFLYTLRWG
jgi:hypothetical protein